MIATVDQKNEPEKQARISIPREMPIRLVTTIAHTVWEIQRDKYLGIILTR